MVYRKYECQATTYQEKATEKKIKPKKTKPRKISVRPIIAVMIEFPITPEQA